MDFLIDPNVSYLLLVAGFVIATLALFAPGTGLLELGALFALVLAGYGIYHISINLWALILLLVGVFPFLLAVRKTHNWFYLVVALAALAVGSAYLYSSPVWWQPGVNPVLAGSMSLLVGVFLWFVARKSLEALQKQPDFNLQKIIGQVGEARSEIHQEGSVYVGGELWSARSPQSIPEHARVRVTRRDGFILEVEPVNPPRPNP
jgi:membrane-bound serine protease (ClpP class)